MDALKESLARRPVPGKKPPAKVERPATTAPAKLERAEKKAQAGRK
jgi:hypothetical protein